MANESEFFIKIKSALEDQGIKLTSEQLEAVEKATDKASEGMEKVGRSAKKGAEGAKELVGGRHGIHALGDALQQALPGMAQFARFFESAFTIAIAAALLAFETIQSKIEDFSKAVNELNTGPGARGEWAEKMADNMRDASVEEAVFNERLAETAARQQTLAETTARLIELQKRQAEDAKAVNDAQKALDIARLEFAQRLGEVTPEQAVRIRLQIDDEAFKRELEAKKAAIQAELSARQNELTASQGSEHGLKGAMDTKESAALAAKNAEAKNAGKLAQDKSNKEAAEQQQKDNDAKLLELTTGSWISQQMNAFEIKFRESQAVKLQNEIGGYATAMHQEEGKETALAAAAAVAKEAAEKAKSDYEEAVKLSAETLKTVQTLKVNLAAQVAQNATLQNLHDESTPQGIADTRDQNRWAQTSRLDIFSTAADAREQVRMAHSAVMQRQGDPQQLHALLNEVVGLARDIHASAAQKHEMENLAGKLRHDIANIQSQLDTHRVGG